jgi:phosphoribosylanthranilate isomerase
MNHIPIKICGLTRSQDVQAAVAAGANALGFVLYPPSPRFVTPQRAAELASLLPAFVTPVLLFVNASADEVAQAALQVPGAWLQFHGDETPAFCQEVAQNLGRRWIRVARIHKETPVGEMPFDLLKYASYYSQAHALLLGHPGRCLWWQWQHIQLVTASNKRQCSPRFVWWTHTCKRGRRHSRRAFARTVAGR